MSVLGEVFLFTSGMPERGEVRLPAAIIDELLIASLLIAFAEANLQSPPSLRSLIAFAEANLQQFQLQMQPQSKQVVVQPLFRRSLPEYCSGDVGAGANMGI